MNATEKNMQITDHENGTYSVASPSGNTYRVEIETRISRAEGSMYFVWTCTCPAGQHHRACKHVAAVQAKRDADGFYQDDDGCGIDVLEREVRN